MSSTAIAIWVVAAILVWLYLSATRSETFTALVRFPAPVDLDLVRDPSPSIPLVVFTDNHYQGTVRHYQPGDAVAFLRHLDDGRRGWIYKSLKLYPGYKLRLTRSTTNNNDSKTIEAQPRFNAIDNIDSYLKEDPALANPATFGYNDNMQQNRGIHYTLTLVKA